MLCLRNNIIFTGVYCFKFCLLLLYWLKRIYVLSMTVFMHWPAFIPVWWQFIQMSQLRIQNYFAFTDLYCVKAIYEFLKNHKKRECSPKHKVGEKKVFLLPCWPKNLLQRSQTEKNEHWVNCKIWLKNQIALKCCCYLQTKNP